MRKTSLCLMALISAAVLPGCGGVNQLSLNATNAESLGASIDALMEVLPAIEQKHFAQNLLVVHRKNVSGQVRLDGLYPSRYEQWITGAPISLLHEMALQSNEILHGKTPDDIARLADQVRVQTYQDLIANTQRELSEIDAASRIAQQKASAAQEIKLRIDQKLSKFERLKEQIASNIRYSEKSRHNVGSTVRIGYDATMDLRNLADIPIASFVGSATLNYETKGSGNPRKSAVWIELPKPIQPGETVANVKEVLDFQYVPADANISTITFSINPQGVKRRSSSGLTQWDEPFSISQQEQQQLRDANNAVEYCTAKVKSLGDMRVQRQNFSDELNRLISAPKPTEASVPSSFTGWVQGNANYCR